MEDWIIGHLENLNPIVTVNLSLGWKVVRYNDLVKELGVQEALLHDEVSRIINWIYENAKDPS